MISHPIGNLQVENGDLWEVYPGPPTKRNRYMAAPPMEIIGKIGTKEFMDRWRYEFRTKYPVEVNWGMVLRDHLPPGSYVTWDPGTDVLVMECRPEQLPFEYAKLKKAVADTNSAYANERKRLIREVESTRNRQAADGKSQAERSARAKKAFDSLEL